jgi:hypothetical protein
VGSLGLCIAVALLVARTSTVLGLGLDSATFGALVAFGSLVGTTRPWWPSFHLAFVLVLCGGLSWALSGGHAPGLPAATASTTSLSSFLLQTSPFAVAAAVASAWKPLAGAIRRLQASPVAVMVSVNVLNVADAILTAAALRHGNAVELNPIVRYAGLPLKIVFVGVLSAIVYRRKPAALVWPTIALAWVILYHVSGLLVDLR